jgi:hypothetical protein
MNTMEKEVLVRLLVEEVIDKLIISSKIRSKKVVSKNQQSDNWYSNKKLITSIDVDLALTKKYKKIIVSPKTIITPLALDLFKENGIKIIRSNKARVENEKEILSGINKNKIAVLSNIDDEAYKIKAKQILIGQGFEADCLSPKNFTSSELQVAVNNLAVSILHQEYFSGIVISNDSYQLMKSQKETTGIKSNICWEISSGKICNSKSNILFINSSLIGFKQLELKLNTWIQNFNGNG